ncbi:lysozyme-like protein 5 [Ditylenchus destructor]|uniref:Lysozyme-like protein 5 n=1 Tax=Ditylenchus destructor TaxID=166010 RepID=A0AAD4R9I0_9BILA|nr:lysozyme-like protein 5 [Ditylenchus destructor]
MPYCGSRRKPAVIFLNSISYEIDRSRGKSLSDFNSNKVVVDFRDSFNCNPLPYYRRDEERDEERTMSCSQGRVLVEHAQLSPFSGEAIAVEQIMYALFALFLLLLAKFSSGCQYGFDTTAAVSSDAFSCLKNSNPAYTFFLGRLLQSDGSVDNTGVQNIVNARAGGLAEGTYLVDGYLSPCVSANESCKSATDQAADAINNLNQGGGKIGRGWIQVLAKDNWPAIQTSNQQFITAMASQISAQGAQVGIQTSESDWSTVVGNWTGASQYQLWWVEINGIADYIGFQSFGGWTRPAIHQFNANQALSCSVAGNQNWFFS